MASEPESNFTSGPASEFLQTEDTESHGEEPGLPEHNEHCIFHRGKTYKRGDARPAKQRGRPLTAWYWKYGEEIAEGMNERWMCKPCWGDQKFTSYAVRSNNGIRNHLEKAHKITEKAKTSVVLPRTADNDNSIIPTIFSWENLKLRLIEWIVVMHIAFSQVENDWFRRFLKALSPTLADWIPRAGNTVKAWILAQFQLRRQDIKKQLQASKSRIHLSFDLWSSPNHMSFVAIVGHYMSSQYKVETVLLGLRRLYGSHSGENLAETVLEVISTYGLTGDRIGWFMLDNVNSNDTCVGEILKALEINDTIERRRLRCLGHIINLGARAFLFGNSLDTFENEVGTTPFEDEKKEREIWRKQGPVGKLHNVVTYIRGTSQRREEFQEKARGELEKQKQHLAATVRPDEDFELATKQPLMVVQDNQTRWNSIFSMIQRAFLLKDAIDLFIKRAVEKLSQYSPLPRADELSSNDWNILARIRDILQPFFYQTLRLQSRASRATHGSIWEALPTLDFLHNALEVKSKEYSAQPAETPAEVTTHSKHGAKKSTRKGKKAIQQPTEGCDEVNVAHISNCIDICWFKLRKYYELMDRSPVYAAAVVLNPEHKWNYFETNWKEHPLWIASAKEAVEELWLTMYKDSADSAAAEAGQGVNPGLFHATPRKDPSGFNEWVSRSKYKRTVTKQKPDEYQEYLETEHFPDEESEGTTDGSPPKSVNLCAFWAQEESQHPSLARMAFDVLSIPAMSAECERVFSSTKILLTDRRARMNEDVIEASECLRAWLKAGQLDTTPDG